MKKIILFAIAFLFCNPHLVFSETVALTTFYPAPFGTYDRIRFVPRPEIVGVCRVGTMYTRDSDNTLRFCRDIGLGPDNGAWGPLPDVWERDLATNEVFLTDTDTVDDYSVGIGDRTPDAVLEVSSSGQGFDLLKLSTDDGTDGDLFVVKSDGKVGIGTVAPAVELEVQSPNPGQTILRIQNAGAIFDLRAESGPNDLVIQGGGVDRIIMQQNDDILIAPTSGSVTIADSSTPGAPEPLNVNGGIKLKSNGTNYGELIVAYDSGGYYAVYAP